MGKSRRQIVRCTAVKRQVGKFFRFSLLCEPERVLKSGESRHKARGERPYNNQMVTAHLKDAGDSRMGKQGRTLRTVH